MSEPQGGVNLERSMTLEQLQAQRTANSFSQADLQRLEIFLTDAEFEQTFNQSRAQFDAQPKWRQINLKRQRGLF